MDTVSLGDLRTRKTEGQVSRHLGRDKSHHPATALGTSTTPVAILHAEGPRWEGSGTSRSSAGSSGFASDTPPEERRARRTQRPFAEESKVPRQSRTVSTRHAPAARWLLEAARASNSPSQQCRPRGLEGGAPLTQERPQGQGRRGAGKGGVALGFGLQGKHVPAPDPASSTPNLNQASPPPTGQSQARAVHPERSPATCPLGSHSPWGLAAGSCPAPGVPPGRKDLPPGSPPLPLRFHQAGGQEGRTFPQHQVRRRTDSPEPTPQHPQQQLPHARSSEHVCCALGISRGLYHSRERGGFPLPARRGAARGSRWQQHSAALRGSCEPCRLTEPGPKACGGSPKRCPPLPQDGQMVQTAPGRGRV